MSDTNKPNGTSNDDTKEPKTNLTFPRDFTIKVMGKTDSDFKEKVTAIIKKHFPNIKDEQISQRPSKDNNYLALSININAESKEQLDALYQDLSAEPSILMAL